MYCINNIQTQIVCAHCVVLHHICYMSSQRNILSQWKFYVIFQFNLTAKWLVLSVSVAGDIMSLWVFLSSWLSHAHRAAHTDRNLHKCNTSAHLLNSAPTPRPPPQTHTYSTCMYTETHTCTAHTPTTHLHIQSYVGIPVHNCTHIPYIKQHAWIPKLTLQINQYYLWSFAFLIDTLFTVKFFFISTFQHCCSFISKSFTSSFNSSRYLYIE